MTKEDKFIVTDATDIICIGGFGNDLGNIGLLKYNEQEITNMMIENNTKVDDIRLANSLLNTIKKQKEVIDEAIEYIENNKLYHYEYDDEELFEIVVSNKKELLDILKGSGINDNRS